jgi:hypothetical protein
LVRDLQNKRAALGTAGIPQQNAQALVGLIIPPGWVKISSPASITYRPEQTPMPSVKIHLTAHRIDVDEKKRGRVTSTTHYLANLDELKQRAEALLEQFT